VRLRTRLALAFVLLSVVPLTAITLYSYNSSIVAFRRAVEAEEAAIAADMGKRMELATTALSERVQRISAAAQSRDWRARDRAMEDRFREQVVATLGDSGSFVSKLQFIPSLPPPPPPPPRGSHFTSPRGVGGGPRVNARPGTAPSERRADAGRVPPPSRPARAIPPEPPSGAQATQPGPTPGGVVGGIVPPAVPSQAEAEKLAAEARQAIDLIPAATLPPDAQAALANLRNLTITLPKAVAATQAIGVAIEAAAKTSEERARAAERQVEAERRAALNRRSDMQMWFNHMRDGKPVDIPVRQEGRIVGTMNAEISLDRLLEAVLAGRSRESGEIAFAVDAQNRLVGPNRRERATLQSLGLLDRLRNSKDRVQTVSDDNWVVVARRDPSGILFGIARPIGGALGDIRRATGRNLGLGMIAILVALAGIVPISSRMTRNLSVLHAGVKQLAQGNLDARVPVRSKDEIGSLSAAFNQMAQDLGAHQKLIAERERLRGELELCRQIQTEMLPKQPLRLGFAEIKGVSIPAREVGGDFFNYFLLPNGEVALLVGDVSGKGVGAALLMANVQATLRARLSLERDLATLADAIDHEIDEATPKAVYLTLFMGFLDSSHRVLRYVNAGHNPQFVLRAEGGLDRLPSTGLPIAMFPGHGYKEASVTLNEGDILFFYTDGITEVENERGEMFGTDRLEELVLEHHKEGVDALLAHIEQEVLTFRGAADLFDDATMMVLRLGAAAAAPSSAL